MSETARQVITKALRLIWRTGENEPIESYDMNLGIEELNDFMAELESNGCDLSHTVITDQTDVMTIADGALGPTKRCLAYRLWDLYYRESPQPITMMLFNDAYNSLLNIGFEVEAASYPDTLPIGAGNEGNSRYYDHFFPNDEEDS